MKNLGSENDHGCRILIDDYDKEFEAGCLQVPGLQPSNAEEDILSTSSTSAADNIIRASNSHQLRLTVPESQNRRIPLSEDYAINIIRGEGENLTKSIAERDDSTSRGEVETTADAGADGTREMADGGSDAVEDCSNASRRKDRRRGGRKVNVFNSKTRKSTQQLTRIEKKEDRKIHDTVGTTCVELLNHRHG